MTSCAMRLKAPEKACKCTLSWYCKVVTFLQKKLHALLVLLYYYNHFYYYCFDHEKFMFIFWLLLKVIMGIVGNHYVP